MEQEKRKIRICLICVVLLAVTVGIIYVLTAKTETQTDKKDGTLVKIMDMQRGDTDGGLITDAFHQRG